MVDVFQTKRYDVNMIYTGSYDSISSYEIKRDPVRKPVFELAKWISQCLSNDLGDDRVYYPERDMLGGVNFFDEFDRVIEGSFVTLLIVSKDIKENPWFKWLNHSAVRRQKDKVGLNTIFLAAPGMQREDIIECRCEFMLVDHVIYVGPEPKSQNDILRSKWYDTIKRSILEFTGRTTTNRQISEQAQAPGAMSSRPQVLHQPQVAISYEEEGATNSAHENLAEDVQISQEFHGPRGDASPSGARAERRTDEPNFRSPEEATDPPTEGIDGVLPATKEAKQDAVLTPPRAENTTRRTQGLPPRTDNTTRPTQGHPPRAENTTRPTQGHPPRAENTTRPTQGHPPTDENTTQPTKWNMNWKVIVTVTAALAVVIIAWRRSR